MPYRSAHAGRSYSGFRDKRSSDWRMLCMQITNRNTHTAWAAKVDELLELYLAIRGDELLKRRDFVPQLLASLTWCLHKVYNNKK